MDITTLLNDNALNFIIIFVLAFIGFVYRKRTKKQYFDNIIKYADILEKTPQPKYQKDYINNLKKKLLWEKVCFYQSGNINKERIAISLINADIHNIIALPQLNLLTQYFKIKQNKIIPINLFLIKEVLFGGIALLLGVLIIISNLKMLFRSTDLVNIVIAIITILIVTVIAGLFSISPLKRLKTYWLILKDRDFLKRANVQLSMIIEECNQVTPLISDEVTSDDAMNEQDTKQQD